MNRTAEKVLGIISAVLIGIGILIIVALTSLFKVGLGDPELRAEMANEIVNAPDIDITIEQANNVLDVFASLVGIGWLIAGIGLLALVLTIVAVVQLKNEAKIKSAGTLFIIAGIFSGVLSLASILLYVAAIITFTKKPPVSQEPFETDMRPFN